MSSSDSCIWVQQWNYEIPFCQNKFPIYNFLWIILRTLHVVFFSSDFNNIIHNIPQLKSEFNKYILIVNTFWADVLFYFTSLSTSPCLYVELKPSTSCHAAELHCHLSKSRNLEFQIPHILKDAVDFANSV